MARSLVSLTSIPTSLPRCRCLNNKPFSGFLSPTPTRPQAIALCAQRRRGEVVVVRAGPPSTTSLVLAFVLPFSLIAGTVFASIRIADSLDEKFLEELAMNQAIMEEREAQKEDDGEEDGDDAAGKEGGEEEGEKEEEKIAVVPRARNRPRREA